MSSKDIADRILTAGLPDHRARKIRSVTELYPDYEEAGRQLHSPFGCQEAIDTREPKETPASGRFMQENPKKSTAMEHNHPTMQPRWKKLCVSTGKGF